MESGTNDGERSSRLCLSQISVGETATILNLGLEGRPRDYVMRFGFVPGADIRVLREVPLSGIRIYQVGSSQIALRRETAKAIIVTRALV